jgi:hypothetical protein
MCPATGSRRNVDATTAFRDGPERVTPPFTPSAAFDTPGSGL